MMAKRIPILIFLMVPVFLMPQSSYIDSLFIKANQEYRAQNFASASNMYHHIMNQGYGHADLFYNMGNAYYHLAQLGDAIWAYEKGLQLNPRDGDLRFNLKVANARMIDRVEAPDSFVILDMYRSIKYGFSSRQWLDLISILVLVSGLLFIVSKYVMIPFEKILRKMTWTLLGIASVSLLVFFDQYYELSKREEAIVVSNKVDVYSAPTNLSSLVFVMHEGTKLKVTNNQPPWVEVELIDGKKGWVTTELIREL